MSQSHRVCVVAALEAYIDLPADPLVYLHDDPVYPFKHEFMSQVVDKHHEPRRDKCFSVGPGTCSRWMRNVMDRIGVDERFKGGSIRMAAALAAVDRGMPIKVVLSMGRWTSWGKFSRSSTIGLNSML